MESQLDSERGPGKNKKKWNENEDEKLVAAMLDVLNSGGNYKSDNGFKPGFFSAVERQLAKSLPEAGIKAKPHIESRVKTMKSDWSAIHDMLAWNNTSGFGWDYNNDMLDAPQPVWQAYIQVHKNAAKWRAKKFPHYWDLCNVFGKDRANGRDAQTAADIIFDINREEPEATEEGLDDIDVNQPINIPSYDASREESSTQRKRRRRNSWDPLMNSLKESAEIISAEIRGASNTFNRVFGTESNREELRNNLFAEMNKVAGLTTRECDKAVCKLAQNEELMVVFFKVDEDRKLGWVKNMLEDTV
ncbi:putative Myb/SANT-like domain-containing protein [Helianthus debilis subsp. tardiflorus]